MKPTTSTLIGTALNALAIAMNIPLIERGDPTSLGLCCFGVTIAGACWFRDFMEPRAAQRSEQQE